MRVCSPYLSCKQSTSSEFVNISDTKTLLRCVACVNNDVENPLIWFLGNPLKYRWKADVSNPGIAFNISLFWGDGEIPQLLVRMALVGCSTDNHSFPVIVSVTVPYSILVQDTFTNLSMGNKLKSLISSLNSCCRLTFIFISYVPHSGTWMSTTVLASICKGT